MTSKNPFDFNEMMKAFDPEAIAKMFDPKAMFAMFQPKDAPALNLQDIIQSNQRNFDAMIAANAAAAAAYRDLLERQMQIFEEMTASARQQLEAAANAGPEALGEKAAAYGAAVEQALDLMRQLAENTRQANEQAFNAVKDKLAEAISQTRPK
ncbi:MAG TPA: phasin family protein [Paracoccaceae bacterium]